MLGASGHLSTVSSFCKMMGQRVVEILKYFSGIGVATDSSSESDMDPCIISSKWRGDLGFIVNNPRYLI